MGSSYRLTPGDLGIPNKTATGGSSQVSKSGEQVPYSEMAMARYKPFSGGISVLKLVFWAITAIINGKLMECQI